MPSKNKLISIIIPCYNCAETIIEVWNSLKHQTIGIENIECIFVDDASSDGGITWNTLQAIESEAPDSVIIIQLNENMRQGGARNVGLDHASGKYIQFLDADDELVENACELLYDTAEQKQSDIIQFNHIYRLEEQSRISTESRFTADYPIRTSSDRYQFLNASLVTYGCTNKLYKRSLIEEAEARFAEYCVYEEPLFVYPCFLYARHVSLITDPLYIYNLHEGSTVTSTIGIRLLDHPHVQLKLLEYCMKRPSLYAEYKEVIELYFLWSYYCETLSFAGQHYGAILPLEYFSGMQKVCQTIFPEWRSNPSMTKIPRAVLEVLKSIDTKFESQDQLNEYISFVASNI